MPKRLTIKILFFATVCAYMPQAASMHQQSFKPNMSLTSQARLRRIYSNTTITHALDQVHEPRNQPGHQKPLQQPKKPTHLAPLKQKKNAKQQWRIVVTESHDPNPPSTPEEGPHNTSTEQSTTHLSLPETARVLFEHGINAYKANNSESAAHHFEKLVQQYPANRHTSTACAYLADMTNDPAKELSYLNKALTPDNILEVSPVPYLFQQRADLLYVGSYEVPRDHTRALDDYQRALISIMNPNQSISEILNYSWLPLMNHTRKTLKKLRKQPDMLNNQDIQKIVYRIGQLYNYALIPNKEISAQCLRLLPNESYNNEICESLYAVLREDLHIPTTLHDKMGAVRIKQQLKQYLQQGRPSKKTAPNGPQLATPDYEESVGQGYVLDLTTKTGSEGNPIIDEQWFNERIDLWFKYFFLCRHKNSREANERRKIVAEMATAPDAYIVGKKSHYGKARDEAIVELRETAWRLFRDEFHVSRGDAIIEPAQDHLPYPEEIDEGTFDTNHLPIT